MKGYRKHWRYFNATFTYLGSTITVSRGIDDEDNDFQARFCACQGMLMDLREIGLFRNSCIESKSLVEVRRKDTVSWKETVEQIEKAEEAFKAMDSSTNKLVIAMANAHGVTI